MKTLGKALLLALPLFASCSSSSSKTDIAELSAGVECVCGDEDGELFGCFHPLCIQEHVNPNNPDCVCGPLAFESED